MEDKNISRNVRKNCLILEHRKNEKWNYGGKLKASALMGLCKRACPRNEFRERES